MPTKVYWDSCCFIDLLQRTPTRIPALDELVRQAQRGDLVIMTSALSIAETCKLPQSGMLPDAQARKILDFFDNAYIQIRSVDRAVAVRANEISRKYGLRPADAIHAATALLVNAEVLHTYDKGKGKKKGLLTHNGAPWVEPMRIEEPPPPEKGTLFEKPT